MTLVGVIEEPGGDLLPLQGGKKLQALGHRDPKIELPVDHLDGLRITLRRGIFDSITMLSIGMAIIVIMVGVAIRIVVCIAIGIVCLTGRM